MAELALDARGLRAEAQSTASTLTVALLAVALWLLSRPFTFSQNDGHLYSFLALAWAEPGRFSSDLFIRFGSQDTFSAFSPIYGQLIRLTDLETATVGLMLAGAGLWLLGSWRLAHTLLEPGRARAAVLLLAALPFGYGGFSALVIGENFLTSRIFAEAFGLLALAAFMHRSWIAAGAFMLAAASLHPLMALGAFGTGFLMTVMRQPRLLWLIPIAAVPSIALAFAGVAPFERLLETYDPEWLHAVQLRNTFVFMAAWTVSDWVNLAVQLIAVSLAALHARDTVRRLLLAITACALAGLTVSWLGADVAKNVLITQLQLWRCAWPLAWAAAPSLILLAPRSRHWGDWLVFSLMALALIPSLAWLQLGAAVFAIFCVAFRPSLPPAIAKITVFGILALLATPVVVGTVQLAAAVGDGSQQMLLTALLAGWQARFSWMLALLLFLGLMWRPRAMAWVACGAALLAGLNWDHRSPWTRYVMAGRSPVAAAGEVLWDQHSTNWFLLRQPSWVSRGQASGLLFSRETSRVWMTRASASGGLVPVTQWEANAPLPDCGQSKLVLTEADLRAICATEGGPSTVITSSRIASLDGKPFHTPVPTPSICERDGRLAAKPISDFFAYDCRHLAAP